MKRKLLILMMMCFVGWLTPLKAQETTFTENFDGGSISANWRVFSNDTDTYQWEPTGENTNGYSGEGILSWTFFSRSEEHTV